MAQLSTLQKHSTEMHTFVHQRIWTKMLIVALIVIAKKKTEMYWIVIYSYNGILFSNESEEITNIRHNVEKNRSKTVYTVWFHLYKFPKQTKNPFLIHYTLEMTLCFLICCFFMIFTLWKIIRLISMIFLLFCMCVKLQ